MAGRTRRTSASKGDEIPSKSKRIIEDDDSELEDEEEAVPPLRRRPGKEPMRDEDEEDYIPGEGDDDDAGGAGDEDIADDDGDGDEDDDEGPSIKKRRTSTKVVQRSKRVAEPRRARNLAANGGVGGDGVGGGAMAFSHSGPIALTAADMSRVQDKILQYRHQADAILDRITGAVMTQHGLTALTRHVLRFVLFSHMEKPGVPIPRDRLTKVISENNPAAAKKTHVSSYIIALAQTRMAESFGLDMAEISKLPPGRQDSSALATQGKGAQQYVLRSLVPPPLYEAVIDDGKEHAQRGFLAAIMGLIDLSGGSMSQDDLWRHLNDLGVTRIGEHPKLGEAGMLIDEFVKRRQLTVQRRAGHDGPEMIYSIGENAVYEVGDAKIKTFLEAELGEEDKVEEDGS